MRDKMLELTFYPYEGEPAKCNAALEKIGALHPSTLFSAKLAIRSSFMALNFSAARAAFFLAAVLSF